MIPQNRIWEEMKQAKANIICLKRYTDSKRKWLRMYIYLLYWLFLQVLLAHF